MDRDDTEGPKGCEAEPLSGPKGQTDPGPDLSPCSPVQGADGPQFHQPAPGCSNTVAMEAFLELAGLQRYSSWTRARRLEYKLPGGDCTLVVQRRHSMGG